MKGLKSISFSAICVFALCSALPAMATEKMIAVLEFRNEAELTVQEVEYITDLVRGEAVELPTGDYIVMTRESITEMLPPGMDLARCEAEASCEVEIGRKLGADYLITGAVIRFGSEFKVSMKMHDTKTSRLMISESASSLDLDGLENAVVLAGRRIIKKLHRSGSGSSAGFIAGRFGEGSLGWSPSGRGETTVVSFVSKPKGASVFVDGRMICRATPCKKKVPTGLHDLEMQTENYVPRAESLEFKKRGRVSWKLTPDFGLIDVTSSPSGRSVHLDGKPIGVTPLSRHQVPPGRHELVVHSPCHYSAGERFELRRGKSRKFEIELKPRTGGLRVDATDESGNVVEADVIVDGVKLGRSPDTFQVSICSNQIYLVVQGQRMFSESLDIEENETTEISTTIEGAPLFKRLGELQNKKHRLSWELTSLPTAPVPRPQYGKRVAWTISLLSAIGFSVGGIALMAGGDYEWSSEAALTESGDATTDYNCISDNCWQYWSGVGLLSSGALIGLITGVATKPAFAKEIDVEEVEENQRTAKTLNLKIQNIDVEIGMLKQKIADFD